MSNHKFTLRTMQPSDGPMLTKLITEFDGDMTTRFTVDAYAAITYGIEFRTVGVVVECPEFDGFVGMGTVRFSNVQYNGGVLPLAFLDGLKVHKDFRGQGLGYQIACWRIEQAREAFGEDCVIATGMLFDNHASHAVAKKWCKEFLESGIQVVVLPTVTQPPKPFHGITVREIETHEYQEFAGKQNSFYKQYNLYAPGEANSIADALEVSAQGRKPNRFYVAVDSRGNLLAGAKTWARGEMKTDTLNSPPVPLRVLNRLMHLLPPDFTIRDIVVSGLWYEPGQMDAGRYLWEMTLWKCKDMGTTVAVSFDPRDPAREIVRLKPWHQPRPRITFAIHGPALIEREKLLFGIGRV